MNFLFPSALFGLGLIAIPIIIHFFNFQRAKRVAFTNVAFLKDVKQVTNSRNKLKNLLVLLMRILFIVCLVMAFARPFIPQNETAGTPNGNHVSIYLDNSYSMQNEKDGQRVFDVAINYADQITQSFPKNTVFQLLDNRFEGSMNYFAQADKISDKLGSMTFGNAGRRLLNVLERQHASLKESAAGAGNNVFLISDFQTLNEPELASLTLDSSQNYYLIPLMPNTGVNLLIDSVWLEVPFVKAQETQTIKIKVRNESNEAVENKAVKLFLSDKQVSTTTVNIPASASKVIDLDFAVSEGGELAGKVTIEDLPVLFDNEYFFVLKVAPKINIVSIAGDENVYAREVFSNEPFFNVQHYSINSLDYSSLATADLVVLSNLKEIDNSLQTALRKAIANGTSLAVFPSFSTDAQSYGGLLGLNIRGNNYKPDAPLMGVASPDNNNPFFEGVFDKIPENMNMPNGFQAIAWNSAGFPLLKFKNGQPFLTSLSNGASNMYVFASPLDEKYSNFPKHAVFVPIMYRIALSSKNETGRLAYSFSEDVASVQLEESAKGDVFKLKRGGFEMIPAQRVVDDRLLMNIPKTDMEAGCYEVRHAKSNQLVSMIAFNYGKDESDLSFHTASALQEVLGKQPNVQVFDAIEPEVFAKNFKADVSGNELWRYFIVFGLLFLLAESLIIRFWKK